MFSLQIVDTDAFLEMPVSTQLLYFHLVMRADDEGFVDSPKKIMKLIGVQDDDLKVLIAKRFILTFNSGIIVIKHWLIHNTIRMDRFKETTYIKEKKLLKIKENKAYTELGKPNGNQLVPQVKLSKVKLSKDNILAKPKNNKKWQDDALEAVGYGIDTISHSNSNTNSNTNSNSNIQEIVNYFFELKGWGNKNKDFYKKNKIIYARYTKPAKELLEIAENIGKAKWALDRIKNWADAQEIEWGIETVFKRWFDLEDLPQEKKKKYKIDGLSAYQRGDEWYVIQPNGEHKKWVGSRNKIKLE